MKERLLNNWSFIRVSYVLLGLLIIVQTAMSREWLGVLIGGYLVFMGLFAIGCASGNCSIDSKNNHNLSNENIEFEEVHEK